MDVKVIKNSAWLLVAQGLVKVISFAYTIFLARSLGILDFGYFITALTYFSLLSNLADFGFNRFLIREGAKDLTKLSSLVSLISILRISLTFILIFLFALYILFIDADGKRVNLSLLASLAVLPQALSLTFDAALVAKEKLKKSSIALLTMSLTTSILGIVLINIYQNPFAAVLALILGQFIYAATSYLLIKSEGISFKIGFSQKFSHMIWGTFPYALLSFLGLLYFKVDTLLISYINGVESAAIYGAAYKFLEASILVPSSISAAIFPALSRTTNPESLKKIYLSSLKLLFIFAIILFGIYRYLLPNLILKLLPSYQDSLIVLNILSWTIPLMFLHIPGAAVLVSSSRFLKPVIILSVFTLSFNVLLNLLLLPDFGIIAASYITVLSEGLSLIVFFILLQKVLKWQS